MSLFNIRHVVGTKETYYTFQNILLTTTCRVFLIMDNFKKVFEIKPLRNRCANPKDIHVWDLVVVPVNVDAEILWERLLDKMRAHSLVKFASFCGLHIVISGCYTPVLLGVIDSFTDAHQATTYAFEFTFAEPLSLCFLIMEQCLAHFDDLRSINQMSEVILMQALYFHLLLPLFRATYRVEPVSLKS